MGLLEEKQRLSRGVGLELKAALQKISQVLAMEVASEKIRVNVICPAVIEDTELNDPHIWQGQCSFAIQTNAFPSTSRKKW